MADAVDEKIGIKARFADQGQKLAAGDIHHDYGPRMLAKCFDRRQLQIEIEADVKILAR